MIVRLAAPCRCVPLTANVKPRGMVPGQSTFVAEVAAALSALNSQLSGACVLVSVRRAPDGGKIVAEFEGPGHLALVEAWEHSKCMDVTVHSKDAQRGTIVAAGPCESEQEVHRRLTMLREALLNE